MNKTALLAKIQTAIASLTTSSTKEELLALSLAVKNVTDNRYMFVNNVVDLPTLSGSTVAGGELYYVKSINSMLLSSNGNWISLDGTVARTDVRQTAIWTAGINYSGMGQVISPIYTSSPISLSLGSIWSKISNSAIQSGSHQPTVGIKLDNTLWTWGTNGYSELGTGNSTARSSPGTTVGGGTNWKQADVYYQAMGAVKTDGTLWTWGRNNNGQLGDGTTNNRSSPGTVAGGGTTWSTISMGYFYAAAIKTDGTLWTWGRNYRGALGDGTTTNRSSPGTVAGGGTTWSSIDIADSHALAIKTDGTLWVWGNNGYGRLGDGTTTARSSPVTVAGGGTNWSSVNASRYSSAAIKTDGTLWTWGYNAFGMLGTGNTTDRSSPGTTIGGGTTWSIVSGNQTTLAAIKTDGTLWTWGRNYQGELGDGTINGRSSPGTTAGGGTNWVDVSMGSHLFHGFRSI